MQITLDESPVSESKKANCHRVKIRTIGGAEFEIVERFMSDSVSALEVRASKHGIHIQPYSTNVVWLMEGPVLAEPRTVILSNEQKIREEQ